MENKQAYSVVDGKITYNNGGSAEISLLDRINSGKTVHFSLIDPDKPLDKLEHIIQNLYKAGTDVLLVGGSSGVSAEKITEIYEIVRENRIDLDVILFPTNIGQLTGRFDAVLYMNCPTSRKDNFKLDATVEGSPFLREMDKVIPLTYLVVEPGGFVGQVADVQLLPRNYPKLAVMHAKAAWARGSRWIYLEAGSGADPGIHEKGGPELIRAIKQNVNLPLIVGGGIKTPEAARIVKKAGADGIVTGNIIEEDLDLTEKIISAIHE